MVISQFLCQQERGADSLVAVLMGENGEEDALDRGSVGADAHGSGASADLAEAPLDSVGGPGRLAPLWRREAEGVEEVFEVMAQASDGLWIRLLPAPGRMARRHPVFRFMMSCRSRLTARCKLRSPQSVTWVCSFSMVLTNLGVPPFPRPTQNLIHHQYSP